MRLASCGARSVCYTPPLFNLNTSASPCLFAIVLLLSINLELKRAGALLTAFRRRSGIDSWTIAGQCYIRTLSTPCFSRQTSLSSPLRPADHVDLFWPGTNILQSTENIQYDVSDD